MSDTQKETALSVKNSKPGESFASGLFSLMTKQCIFSAAIFGVIYSLKIINIPFFNSVCSVIKNVVGFNLTFDYIKNIFIGLFL